jgi:hypothetical protein
VVVVKVTLTSNDGVVSQSSWGRPVYEQNSGLQKKQRVSSRTVGAPHDTLQTGTPALGQQNAQLSWGTSEQYQNQIPIWCHVNKSNTPSSIRTRVAALAYLNKQNEYISGSKKHHRTKYKRHLNEIRKKRKQDRNVEDVTFHTIPVSKHLPLEFNKNNVVVCDGGESVSTIIDKIHADKNIHILWISNLDLWVADTKNCALGLRLILPGESFPVFIHLPWTKSLEIMCDGKDVCATIRSCAETQRQPLSRGLSNRDLTDDGNKYYCVGAQPGRAMRGGQLGLHKLKHGYLDQHWVCVHNVLKHAKHAFDMFMNTDVIRHIVEARKRVHFCTMEPSPSSADGTPARYYNAVGFGLNVLLRSHIDKDFTMSIVQVHLDDITYDKDDRIVCYFAFPRVGIAVALGPGDFLMFNPQEPRSLSLR